MNLQEIITIGAGIGVFIAGIGYVVSQFRKGRIDGEMATLDLLSKKVDELEKLSNSQDKEIVNLTKKINDLELAIKERDKKIDEYMAILQNRNPQFEAFIQLVTRVATDSETYMGEDKKKTDDILAGVNKLVGAMQATALKQ